MSDFQNASVAVDGQHIDAAAVDRGNLEETDARLLSNLAQGDTDAFWQLWERYGVDLHRCCCCWMRGNHADAEDVLGNAMLKAWRKLPEYASEINNVKGWMMRLTHNLCIDMQRARRRQAYGVEDIDDVSETCPDAFSLQTENPCKNCLDSEMNDYMNHAIAALPVRLREPVMMRFLQEASYQDIAEQLDLSNANVRKRIQLARSLLQIWLRDYVSEGKRPVMEALEKPQEFEGSVEAQANIRTRHAVSHTVYVRLPSGEKRPFRIVLDRKPMRLNQKIRTLHAYVLRHPGGWKKQLELAELLYMKGQWEEAITAYRKVLEKQPRRYDIWLQLGHILHRMERLEEAADVYERAQNLTQNEGWRLSFAPV